ncbi:MAG: hypothetical protein ABIN91_04090 [Mucilaginibacter sp.]
MLVQSVNGLNEIITAMVAEGNCYSICLHIKELIDIKDAMQRDT